MTEGILILKDINNVEYRTTLDFAGGSIEEVIRGVSKVELLELENNVFVNPKYIVSWIFEEIEE